MANTYLRAHQASNAVGRALSPYNNKLEVRVEETKNLHFIHITPRTSDKNTFGNWDWKFRSQIQGSKKIYAPIFKVPAATEPNTLQQTIQQQSEGDQLVTVTIEESELESAHYSSKN